VTDEAQGPRCRHLLAPELEAALAYFPEIDLSQGIAPFRERAPLAERPPLPAELEAVKCERQLVPGLNGAPDVPVLVYTPPGLPADPRPTVLHIHGGGYIMGDAMMNDAMNRATSLALGCVVASVDYRLAPETAWPGAVEDCYAALTWLVGNATRLGVDPARIAVTGESAGGGHAAALALYVRDRQREDHAAPALCFQLLDCPMLDDRSGSLAEPHPHTGEFVWTAETNHFGWTAMLGCEAGTDQVPPGAVPARVEDLKDLPPAFLILGALDLFLEETLEYARRLTRAGVPMELHVIPGAYHGYSVMPGSPQTVLTTQLKLSAMARALGVEPVT